MDQTLNTLLPGFTKSLEDKGRSPSTVLAYRSDLEQLITFLHDRSKVTAGSVQGTDLEAFRDSLLADKYTPKSVSRKLNAIKTFFRWMLAEKHIGADPSRNVSHPKIEPSVPKFLSQLEYRALRDIVREDVRIAAIIELILQTGMRISEVATLKTANISKDAINIDAYATQEARTIPLTPRGRAAVDAYLEHRPNQESEYLFVSKNGKALAVRNIRAAIDRLFNKAGVPQYSVNDLRTTFIIENLKAGVDLVMLSKVAGHKRLSTTERYLELAGVENPGKKQDLQEL